ncbi:hypothetical protein [Microbacterium sp. S1037]|uniref:hypothetical protein n=1 Tax=Microbacterium sp. S1037 TaxID=3398227 RepID=UPI003AAED685
MIDSQGVRSTTAVPSAQYVIGWAKELPMFGAQGVARLVWTSIEDDFLIGACSHRIVGFVTLGRDERWDAFDGDSAPLASFDALSDAKVALWDAHNAEHARECEPRDPLATWQKLTGAITRRLAGQGVPGLTKPKAL